MTEKEINEILLNSERPAVELHKEISTMKTTYLFIVCTLAFGWVLYILSTNKTIDDLDSMYKQQNERMYNYYMEGSAKQSAITDTLLMLNEMGFRVE